MISEKQMLLVLYFIDVALELFYFSTQQNTSSIGMDEVSNHISCFSSNKVCCKLDNELIAHIAKQQNR